MKFRNNKVQYITALVVILIFIFSFIYYYNHSIVSDAVLQEVNPTDYAFQIDSIELENNKLSITGWCFNRNEDLTDPEKIPVMKVVLVDSSDNNKFYYRAQYGIAREDVNEYFRGGHEYVYCGFSAEIGLSSLDTEHTDYEIVFQQNERNQFCIRPGLYIHEGRLMNADPSIYEPLAVENTDLEGVVNDGILKVYRPDLGVYVYQYGWKLFWIIDDNYPLAEKNLMEYAVYTSNPDKLPDYRRGSDWDNLKFNFTDAEITQVINAGQYRAAVRDIPTDYPVTIVFTGFVYNGWDWVNSFYPGIPE